MGAYCQSLSVLTLLHMSLQAIRSFCWRNSPNAQRALRTKLGKKDKPKLKLATAITGAAGIMESSQFYPLRRLSIGRFECAPDVRAINSSDTGRSQLLGMFRSIKFESALLKCNHKSQRLSRSSVRRTMQPIELLHSKHQRQDFHWRTHFLIN